MVPLNSRSKNRQNLNGDWNPAQLVNPSKPHFRVKKKTQACIGWLWQRGNKFAFPNLLTYLSGYHEWMHCICQYSTQWQLKIEKLFEKKLQIICLHTRDFVCPACTVNCTPEQDKTEQQSWLWLWEKNGRGSLGRNRSLKHCSTQWTPPPLSNALDLCRSWEVSALNGYFYFKSLKFFFNPFVLILLWSFHSALPDWNREHATKRTGVNDEKYPLLSAFCVCWKRTDFLGKYQEDICDWACSNEHELCCASKACCTFRWFHHFTIQLLW